MIRLAVLLAAILPSSEPTPTTAPPPRTASDGAAPGGIAAAARGSAPSQPSGGGGGSTSLHPYEAIVLGLIGAAAGLAAVSARSGRPRPAAAAAAANRPGPRLVGAARAGDVEAVRRELANPGARAHSLDAPDEFGQTALAWACRGGHVDVVRVLLAAGADVDMANDDGATPLWIACGTGAAEAARLLLAAGADPTLRTKDRHPYLPESPAGAAVRRGHRELAALVEAVTPAGTAAAKAARAAKATGAGRGAPCATQMPSSAPGSAPAPQPQPRRLSALGAASMRTARLEAAAGSTMPAADGRGRGAHGAVLHTPVARQPAASPPASPVGSSDAGCTSAAHTPQDLPLAPGDGARTAFRPGGVIGPCLPIHSAVEFRLTDDLETIRTASVHRFNPLHGDIDT